LSVAISENLAVRAEKRALPLDVLRVAAILLVFAFHFPKVDGQSLFGLFARFGWAGVDLFFVLSGYLIGSQIMRLVSQNRFTYQHFYVSRFLRTLPVYLVVLAVYFTVTGFREKPEIPPVWKFLTFTQNFDLSTSAFSHAWSLCIEEQFYLICPFVILILWRLKRPAYAWALALAIIALGFTYRHFAWQEFSAAATSENEWDIYLASILSNLGPN
jgi:peptidoglycan/LPS O-acetylase OafA/YrhL